VAVGLVGSLPLTANRRIVSKLRPLYQELSGRLFRSRQRAILLLDPELPPVTLRYAFAELYGEAHVLPALLLDDWGKVIKNLALYRWVRQYGDQFPRAELFGFYPDGREAQYFLRELDLHHRHPCYVYANPDAPLAAGALLDAILLAGTNAEPHRIRRPAGLDPLLRNVQAGWWQLDPASPLLAGADFSFLDAPWNTGNA
jgi:hypothetical protein